MDLHNFLRSRRSIRNFKPVPVEIEILKRIIETATYAPSAHNRQPWRFAVIINDQTKKYLSEQLAKDFQRDLIQDGLSENEVETRLNRSKNRIQTAPVVVILCMDMSEMDVYTDSDGQRMQAERTMAIQSVSAAGLQLQLAARAEGLDSVWTCGPLFANQTTRTALNLPDSWNPQAMFFLGFAVGNPKPKVLKSLEEIVKFY